MENIEPAAPFEEPVSQWTEPHFSGSTLGKKEQSQMIGGSILLFALALGAGIWFHSFNYYLAAVGVACALTAVLTQGLHRHSGREITVTTARILVADKVYALDDLAGFWLKRDDTHLVVSLEYKKPSLIPPTFFYATSDENEARATLTKVLPELEPREEHFSEGIGRYFKL